MRWIDINAKRKLKTTRTKRSSLIIGLLLVATTVHFGICEDSYVAPVPVQVEVEDPLEFVGIFNCSAYTAGHESTGKRPGDKGYGITYSGAEVKEQHTIAADWLVLPEGTKVQIEGFGDTVFVVEDTGSAIKENKIDIYYESLDDALQFGRKDLAVWRVR